MMSIIQSPISAAIIGALLGSIGTYLTRSYFRHKEKTERAQQLRRSLFYELAEMQELAAYSEDRRPSQVSLALTTTTVFENNAAEIGMLSSEEVEALVRFYTSAQIVSDQLGTTIEVATNSEVPGVHDYSPIKENILSLQTQWVNAISVLSDKLYFVDDLKLEHTEVASDVKEK